MVGRTIANRYEILQPIGAGGMGAVYLARQVAMDRNVAIKVLHRQFLRDESSRKRFVREMQATSAISHPNTVTVYDYGTTEEEEAYLVMELLSGKTLHEAIIESGAMPTSRLAHITRQIAQALANAHDKGIVHRDIKPENIMLLDSYGVADWVKVLDFGIARIGESPSGGDLKESLTQTGTVLGTPSYMSPERAMGKPMDHRSDIYAVGVLMYVMATGRTPFEATEPMSVLFKHVSEPVPSVSEKTNEKHPEWLDTLIGRLMAKEPSDRPDSLHEVVQLLEAHKTSTMPTLPAAGEEHARLDHDGDTKVVPTQSESAERTREPSGSRPTLPKARTIIKPSSGYARKPTMPRMIAKPPSEEPEPVEAAEPEPTPEPEPEEPRRPEPTMSVQREPDWEPPPPRPPKPPPPPPSAAARAAKLIGALAIVAFAGALTVWVIGEMMGSGGTPGNTGPVRNTITHTGPPIRVGVLHSLSGPMADAEKPVSEAIKLAISEINKEGGISGRTIDAFSADGHSDPEHFQMEAERLISEEQVSAIFGGWTSASRRAIRTVVERHDNLLIYPAAYEGLETSQYIVYTGATPNQFILPAVKWAYTELEARRFYLVGTDYISSKVSNAVTRDAIKKMGGRIVGETYLPPGSKDVDKLASQLARKKPDVILNTLAGASNAALLAALHEDKEALGKPTLISFSLSERALQALTQEHLTGHYVAGTYFQNVEREENLDFLKAFRKKYGHERVVTEAMASAYASVYLWAKAVEESKKDTPKLVRASMRGMSYDAPGGTSTLNAETAHASKYARIARIEAEGKLKLVYASVEPIEATPFPASRSKNAWHSFLDKLYKAWGNRWSAPAAP